MLGTPSACVLCRRRLCKPVAGFKGERIPLIIRSSIFGRCACDARKRGVRPIYHIASQAGRVVIGNSDYSSFILVLYCLFSPSSSIFSRFPHRSIPAEVRKEQSIEHICLYKASYSHASQRLPSTGEYLILPYNPVDRPPCSAFHACVWLFRVQGCW